MNNKDNPGENTPNVGVQMIAAPKLLFLA